MATARLIIILVLNSVIKSKSLAVTILKQILVYIIPKIFNWIKKKVKPLIILVMLSSCQTPRLGGILKRSFSEQASTAIMKTDCNGVKENVVGVFACEEKSPSNTKLTVKVMPVQGRVIYSNGLEKKIEDFNWQESGFWIWKNKNITDTWVDLDLGDLKTTFGDSPIAFDVAGITDIGVIVNRGLIYYRRCDDVTIPCSYLVVKYACNDKIKNTWANQIGYCNRISGGTQALEIPIKGHDYLISKGGYLHLVSGNSDFEVHHKVTEQDIGLGFVKIEYPEIQNGPTLLGLKADFYENGVRTQKQTYILIVGYSAAWTGIDKPHFLTESDRAENDDFLNTVTVSESITFYKPVLSDLLEVVSNDKRQITYKNKIEFGEIKGKTCAYAWQRSSGDITESCINKEGANGL